MFRPSPLSTWAAAAAAALLLLSTGTGHGDPASGATSDTGELLQGTWLREYEAGGNRIRRVLVLAPGGSFREAARAVDAAGTVTDFVHEGTWLFDGTNLKRKYTLVDGRPPSRLNLPFATFEVTFDGRNEFRGVDHVHRNRIHYRRTTDDARP